VVMTNLLIGSGSPRAGDEPEHSTRWRSLLGVLASRLRRSSGRCSTAQVEPPVAEVHGAPVEIVDGRTVAGNARYLDHEPGRIAHLGVDLTGVEVALEGDPELRERNTARERASSTTSAA